LLGISQIAALFPELDFYLEFDEPMMEFWGYARWVNGEWLADNYLEFRVIEEDESTTPEDMEGGISVFDEAGALANHFIRDM
jgi:hypothetical protein